METPAFLWIALLVLGTAFASHRLREAVLTAPLLVVAAGGAFGLARMPPPGGADELGDLRLLFELTLCLVVFASATGAAFAPGRVQRSRLLRLALVGLPLTIGLGTLLARALWPRLAAGTALLLATLSAATDSEVARPFFDGRRTPAWASGLLEAEGSYTDGLLLTAVWAALVVAGGAVPEGQVHWALLLARAVGLAIVVGAAVGWAGGRLLDWGSRHGVFEPGMRELATLALAVLAWTLAARLGTSGLTSTFCAGLVLARTRSHVARDVFEFLDEEGQLLLLVAFAVAGALLVPLAVHHATWRSALWAGLSLTLLRMVPVWLALARTGLGPGERVALGWMGPRGIPTLVLALVWRDQAGRSLDREVLGAVSLVVIASIVLHGVTARGTGRWLGRMAAGER